MCSHSKAQGYIRDKIAGGTRQFDRKNSHVQTVMGANNCQQCKSFIKTHSLDTKLF